MTPGESEQEEPRYVAVGFGFMPSWWYYNYGLDFGRRYFHDPDYRAARDQEAARWLRERFKDKDIQKHVSLWPRAVNPEIVTGAEAIAAVLGCQVHYASDTYPWAYDLNLSREEVMKILVPNLEEVPYLREIARQVAHIQAKYGTVGGSINCQGVLNIALKVRGKELFVDFYEAPDVARHLLHLVCDTIISVHRWEEQLHDIGSNYWIANCTVTMISPGIYEKFVLPEDIRLCETFGKDHVVSIHHCGRLEPYSNTYKVIMQHAKSFDCLQIGSLSNLNLVRGAFPDIRISQIISPNLLKYGSEAEIISHFKRLLKEGGPLERLHFECVDIEYESPDDNLRLVRKTLEKYGEFPVPG